MDRKDATGEFRTSCQHSCPKVWLVPHIRPSERVHSRLGSCGECSHVWDSIPASVLKTRVELSPVGMVGTDEQLPLCPSMPACRASCLSFSVTRWLWPSTIPRTRKESGAFSGPGFQDSLGRGGAGRGFRVHFIPWNHHSI